MLTRTAEGVRERYQFGEYRTRRLVLEAWDRMEANGKFKGMAM